MATSSGDDDRVERLVIKDLEADATFETKADAVFIFIAARPRTEWIERGQIMTDEGGFVVTGRGLTATAEKAKNWPLERAPYLLENCQPDIFAAGDVRSGAMNRVVSAVGEGAMAIKFVHAYLVEN